MTFLYVALDGTREENLELARRLVKVDSPFGFKVNLDAALDLRTNGPTAREHLSSLRELGKPLFVDLKMWNGPRTMSDIARDAAAAGIDIINMHSQADVNFIRRVAAALDRSTTYLFCTTVLSHYTEDHTQRLYGRDFRAAVRMFAEIAKEGGADGIILPVPTLAVVRDLELLKLCPGIRPSWYEDKRANDQEQTGTPTEAVQGGAEYVVVGSPIRKAERPEEALERILQEIREANPRR
ncbi:MAG: orotidine 5'-phosphate decarboxylase [Candidatus Woesearchaeota archaeon]|nr:MAG: orotidine 5'-phosphate decarboxylase [Candidatus Woesearchaeota archaeon]